MTIYIYPFYGRTRPMTLYKIHWYYYYFMDTPVLWPFIKYIDIIIILWTHPSYDPL